MASFTPLAPAVLTSNALVMSSSCYGALEIVGLLLFIIINERMTSLSSYVLC